ncbi:MAG: CotH kinase family protein [Bacteroidota bacterium]
MIQKNRIAILLFMCFIQQVSAQTFSATGDTIPDDGSTIDFPITVNGIPNVIDTSAYGLESVCIDLTHTWDSDLDISLVAPDGTLILLSSANGGDGDGYTSCFNNTATACIMLGSAPFNGTFRPQGQLGRVNNLQNPNGTWFLRIHDTYAFADWGILFNWSITFSTNPATYKAFTSSDIPLVIINTNNQVISSEPKIMVHMGIIDNGAGQRNNVTDTMNIYNGWAGIEIRGHSSSGFPQKQYAIETRDSLGNDSDAVLLGMPSEHDWILYAPYTDKSLMRNRLTYKLASETGNYAVRGRFAELIIDDQYEGIYELTEKIKRDANRVDIAKLTEADTTGDDLTGGYIVKIDWVDGPSWTSNYLPDQTNPGNNVINFQLVYPRPDIVTVQQQNYIQLYIDSFETALTSPSFTNPVTGWRKFAMENTFIDFFLLNELSKNVDGYRLSTYFFKDKNSNNGRIQMGPLWDFNLAWHNADYCGNDSTSGWAYRITDFCQTDVPFWWKRLMFDSQFKNNLRCRWESLRATNLDTVNLFSYIDSVSVLLQESQVRHFEQWPILGAYVWPNPSPLATTYAEEIEHLKEWIAARVVWLDANIPGSCVTAGTDISYNPDFSFYPNPAKDHIIIDAFHLFKQQAHVDIYNASGVLMFSEVAGVNESNSGMIDLKFYNLEPGIYIIRLLDGTELIGNKKLVVE